MSGIRSITQAAGIATGGGGASAATGAATTAAQGGFGAFLGTAMPYLGFAAQLGLGLLNQDQQATEQRRQRDAANRQLKIQTHQELSLIHI